MTPKEKAEELLKSLLEAEDLFGNYPMCHDTAKHCALVCCDEILSNMFLTHYHPDDATHPHVKYWYEVKKEINKL